MFGVLVGLPFVFGRQSLLQRGDGEVLFVRFDGGLWQATGEFGGLIQGGITEAPLLLLSPVQRREIPIGLRFETILQDRGNGVARRR